MLKSILTAMAVCAHAHAVSESFLNTLAQVESSNNPAAIGDGGLARGLYQMHRPAWEDATRIRRAAGQTVHPYADAILPGPARAYARTYADHLERRLTRTLGRRSTGQEIWCAWNMGYANFARISFDVDRAPSATRRKSTLFAD